MKYHIIATIGLVLCLLGCAGPTDNAGSGITDALLYITAGDATLQALEKHPEWRPRFEAAASAMESLSSGTNVVSAVGLHNAISSLPIKSFQSSRGRLILLGAGGLAYQGFGTNAMSVVPLENTAPRLRAIAAGMRQGITMSVIGP